MKILVTGSEGFVGRNLVWNLKEIRDGKNRTRPSLKIEEIYGYDMENTKEDLEEACENCDFVFHLAGVNRPKEQSEYLEGNFGFFSELLDMLKKHRNTCPVMLASSIQASLAGRFADSEYGKSKLAGENSSSGTGRRQAPGCWFTVSPICSGNGAGRATIPRWPRSATRWQTIWNIP